MMHLYSADRARPLAARLAEVLGEPPSDAMAPEWMAVPSDGMRRWLTLELAGYLGASGTGGTDGVAANIQRAYLGTLRACILAADRRGPGPDADPWGIERLVWSVLAVAEQHADDPVLSTFVALPAGASRYARARRVADLFDRYHLHRPEMIRAWSTDRLVDGTGRNIADHAAWQPHLWRLARAHIGEPSPPERLPALLDRIRADTLTLDLPSRLMLFGFTLLPGGGLLELTQALAHHREVHLFLLEPCHLDADRLLQCSPEPADGGWRPRVGDPTAELVHQPLLRSWGRLHRETAVLLADAAAEDLPVPERVGTTSEEVLPTSLLGRLQRDVRVHQVPGTPLPFDASDRSIQFHACYGPTRQVEVARDALLHLLSAPDSDLTEDDIVVLCPDLDRFAPLIEAVFGPSADPLAAGSTWSGPTGDDPGAPALRYRIADQSIRSTNPVLGATLALLELVAGRFEAAPVLDFLSLAPVRERFRFSDADLATVAEWVTKTNVRWGLDPGHRAPFGLPASMATNTWRAGLDRLLLGSAVYDEDLTLAIGDVAPFGVEGTDVGTVGRLAELMDRLGQLAADTTAARPIAHWVERMRQACDALFATPRDAGWQTEALQRMLADLLDEATTDGVASTVSLEFVDVRRLLDGRLDSMPGRPDFFRGGITVTSMTPLRWIPYRVVCLLGMDQASFGSVTAAGDDLAAAAPRVGDLDPRAEIRESLLEAVLAAGDHLVVVRDGHDVRSSHEVPRAVVTAELFDAVAALVVPEQRAAFETHLEVVHPRQSFDERCFERGALVGEVTWGFDGADLEGAVARRSRTLGTESSVATPLEQLDAGVIGLAELHAFFKSPAEAFFTQRLDARLPRSDQEASALLPVEVGALDKWHIGDRLLEARLAGAGTEQWEATERALGTLPPGLLERRFVTELEAEVEELVSTARRNGAQDRITEYFEVDLTLGNGTRIVGSVPLRLHALSPGPARIQYSRMKPLHRVDAWLDLMALVGSDPSVSWRSLVVGRSADSKVSGAEVVDLVPSVGMSDRAADAVGALEVAVDCYRRGMTEPIPLFPSFSYEVHRHKDNRTKWIRFGGGGDGDDAAVKLAFGSPSFDEIMALRARAGDPPGTGGRVARFAGHLWGAIEASTDEAVPTSSPVPSAGPPGGRP